MIRNNSNISLVVSLIALTFALVAIKKGGSDKHDINKDGKTSITSNATKTEDGHTTQSSSDSANSTVDVEFAEKVKTTLLSDPEIVIEALNRQAKKERKKILARTEIVIRNNPSKYSESAIKIGKIGSKKKVFCFFDPYQSYASGDGFIKQIADKVERRDNDIEFNIIPLVFPTQDYSAAILYICAHKVYKDAKKFQTFLVESTKVTEYTEASWKSIMTKAGYNIEQINNAAKTCEEDVNKLMIMANELGVLNPAIAPAMIATVDGIVNEDYRTLK